MRIRNLKCKSVLLFLPVHFLREWRTLDELEQCLLLRYMCPMLGIFENDLSSLVGIFALGTKEFDNRRHICLPGIIMNGCR